MADISLLARALATTKLKELKFLGTVTYYLIIILLVLAYITVILRLWVRYRITKSPGWDDASMVIALLLFTVYCSFIMCTIFRSRDRKFFNLKDIRITLIYIQLTEIFYVLTTTLLKISLGLFFLRILTKRWQRITFHVILGVSASYGLFYVFVTIFQCGDPAHLMDNLIGKPKCLPDTFLLATGYVYGALNVIADWTFVLIPICILAESNLDVRSKISVGIVMAFGAVGSVSSIMRLIYLRGILLTGGAGITTTSVKATIWAVAEPGTGIIAASIAILRPLIRKVSSDIHTKITSHSSAHASRKSAHYVARKASFPGSNSYEMSDTVILTPMSPNENRTYHSAFSERSNDLWSPTAVVSQANVQRVTSVQMFNGRGIPVQSRV